MLQFLIAFDQTMNTLVHIHVDGWGMADETVSARFFRCHLQGLMSALPYKVVVAIFWWQDNHCYKSWRSEVERNQLPNHYR